MYYYMSNHTIIQGRNGSSTQPNTKYLDANVSADGNLIVDVASGGCGGGTQYDIGNVLPVNATGTLTLVENPSGLAQPLNLNNGGELRVSDVAITTGSDDTLTKAQQVLGYARKDASPSGLRALKCSDDGTLHSYDGGLNIKITTGSDDSITGNLQQNLVYGKYDFTGDLKALKTTADGTMFVKNQDTTSGSDATLTNAQQVVCYGRDSGGGLDALKVDNTGKLEVVQDPEQQTTNIFTGTQTINTGTALTFTGIADKNGAENFNVFIKSTSGSLGAVELSPLLSFDGINFYEPSVPLIGGGGTAPDQYYTIVDEPARYVKVKLTNNGGSAVTISQIDLAWVKGI